MSLLPEISQASAEINKFVAQANIHQTIAPVDPAEFTSPADTLLLASRDPVIREVSVGMTGVEVEAVQNTVSGTPPLSLPNSIGEPLKAWSVDVLPYQEGSGDPSPDNVRPIHGTDKLNLFVEESYDQSATPKAVLTLPQTVYTGTIGSEGGESRWKMVNARDLTWRFAGGLVYTSPTDLWTVVTPETPTGRKPLYCNIAKYSTSSTMFENDIGYGGVINNGNITFKSSIAPSLSDWRTYITNNDVMICYPLATPTTFAVTAPTIPTPTGTATTWATAEDGTVDGMEVTYVGKA